MNWTDTYWHIYGSGGIVVIVLLIYALIWFKRMPSIEGFRDFVAVLDTRGGNIMLLFVASLFFFNYAVHMFYAILGKIADHSITVDNAIAQLAIQFCTTTAFGACIGALLKTMTGDSVVSGKSAPPTPPAAAIPGLPAGQ